MSIRRRKMKTSTILPISSVNSHIVLTISKIFGMKKMNLLIAIAVGVPLPVMAMEKGRNYGKIFLKQQMEKTDEQDAMAICVQNPNPNPETDGQDAMAICVQNPNQNPERIHQNLEALQRKAAQCPVCFESGKETARCLNNHDMCVACFYRLEELICSQCRGSFPYESVQYLFAM